MHIWFEAKLNEDNALQCTYTDILPKTLLCIRLRTLYAVIGNKINICEGAPHQEETERNTLTLMPSGCKQHIFDKL